MISLMLAHLTIYSVRTYSIIYYSQKYPYGDIQVYLHLFRILRQEQHVCEKTHASLHAQKHTYNMELKILQMFQMC